MPFVEIIYKPERTDEATVLAVRNSARSVVATALTLHAPSHLVTEEMVDVTVRQTQELDLIGPPMYVTVLARVEDDRRRSVSPILDDIEEALIEAGAPKGVLVELILSERYSNFVYVER